MMAILNWSLPSILFIMGVFTFVSNRKHLLSMLLSLEYIVLSLFLLLFIYLNMLSYENFFSMMFLTFSVCEGALGLSILVSMIRTHGNDYFQSFNVLQC
uniref:NADH-ubiquinone oxidoreductase chain 4L n=8 Tax=Chrysomyini TaxID=54281 RepID=A7DT91_CHRMG|nr:NADH dehydrogenase subunit 4L [Chrysomya bezziana]YP_007026260.1 NADH dehydrogenase subunit 4L [Chrysomya megacephala]YP_007026286.1 NADH dehydrogenase subunit 4L [Chrysomya saffranea]YP_009093925.1 NADH dehydrogenase subunit 4L [Chrysomya pinguis]YP_009306900.1 NADH dehydrogenase subunit 4L [Chrysomya phaonis]AKN58344.1 NADH dehydrogenase subunit 4L [Chrysomya pacifica]AMH85470.1 NADH dehydrogenase subunit 4L [Chrysomya putoria]AMH85678.1 NADH dehydrogenase subunit 4L [Hemilucilia sp. AC